MAAGGLTGNYSRAESSRVAQVRRAEQEDFEDHTAFADVVDYDGDENGKKFNFAPDASEEVVNFALDDQYLNRKWRRDLIRSITKWGASNIGILLSVFAFCFLGGYMFSSMEVYNEVESCKTYKAKYYAGMDKAREAITATANNFQLSANDRSTQFRSALDTFIGVFKNSSWSGESNCDGMVPEWNFMSATFFCVTVVTSIGYGYIAPETFWGRCVLIAYAVIGIPMCLAALANLGGFLSAVVHYAYHNVCCCGACRENKVDKKAKHNMKAQMIALWRTEPNAPSAAFLEALEESSGDESSEEEAADEISAEQFVPVPISLLILASVIIFGGSIFSYTENWSFLDATYFSFVTVFTIGFGDLVPGFVGTKTGRQNSLKTALLWFFVFTGMTILSMSLQLIQENIQGTVKNIMSHCTRRNTKNSGQQYDSEDSSSESDAEIERKKNNNNIPTNPYDNNAMFLPGPGNWGTFEPSRMPALYDGYGAYDTEPVLGVPSSMSLNYVGSSSNGRTGTAMPSSGVMRPPAMVTSVSNYNDREMAVMKPPPPFGGHPQQVPLMVPSQQFMPPPPSAMMRPPVSGYGAPSSISPPSSSLMRPPPSAAPSDPNRSTRGINNSNIWRPPPSAVSRSDY